MDNAEARLRGEQILLKFDNNPPDELDLTSFTATIRTASGSPGRSARTGSGRRLPASASRGRNTDPSSTPAPAGEARHLPAQPRSLDMIHDTSPEGVFTLVEDLPTSKGWFDGFPYGHPDRCRK